CLAQERNALEDFLGRLWSEARQRGQASIARRGLELLERLDTESGVNLVNLLRPKSGDVEHLEETFRRRFAQLLEISGLAELDEIADDRQRRRTETAHRPQLARPIQRRKVVASQGEKTLGRAQVGAALERVLAVQLEVRRD